MAGSIFWYRAQCAHYVRDIRDEISFNFGYSFVVEKNKGISGSYQWTVIFDKGMTPGDAAVIQQTFISSLRAFAQERSLVLAHSGIIYEDGSLKQHFGISM